jgi:hypothetical protein
MKLKKLLSPRIFVLFVLGACLKTEPTALNKQAEIRSDSSPEAPDVSSPEAPDVSSPEAPNVTSPEAPDFCLAQFSPEQDLAGGILLSVVEPVGVKGVLLQNTGGLRPTASRTLFTNQGDQTCTFKVSNWIPPGASVIAGSVAYHLGGRPLDKKFELLAEKPWSQMTPAEKNDLIVVRDKERDGMDGGTVAVEKAMRAENLEDFDKIIQKANDRGLLRMDGARVAKLCRHIAQWTDGSFGWVGDNEIDKLKPDTGIAQYFFLQWAYALETKNNHRVKLDVMFGRGKVNSRDAGAVWRLELEVPDRLTEYAFTVTRLSDGELKITVRDPVLHIGTDEVLGR